MSECEELLADLRAAAAGAPYTEALREALVRRGCPGFPGRPAEMTDALTRTARQITVNTRYRAGREVFAFLARERIPYAVVKGAVLSRRIYESETARFSGDVDLLLPRKYADMVKECFRENGFQQGRVVRDEIVPYTRPEMIFQATQSHQLAAFVAPTGNAVCPFVNYDVNVELFWGESGQHTDMEAFLADTVSMIAGGVPVQTLPPEHEFAALCLHHYKDWNSVYLVADRGMPLSHFFDLYGYLLTVRPDPAKLRAVCDSIGAGKYVYFCLRLTENLFCQSVTAAHLSALRTPEGEAMTDAYGLNEADRRPWDMPLAERLFDPAFFERFSARLTARDREIIRLNRAMM